MQLLREPPHAVSRALDSALSDLAQIVHWSIVVATISGRLTPLVLAEKGFARLDAATRLSDASEGGNVYLRTGLSGFG